jgi:hypothetical protein
MVGLIIAFPQLVTSGLDKASTVDVNSIQIELPETNYDQPEEAPVLPPGKDK